MIGSTSGAERDAKEAATPTYESYSGNAAENYERYFVPVIGGPLGTELVDRAALQPGERVLDVACGTGVIARLAAERVGVKGHVDGLDATPGMLEVARSITPEPAIRWYEASAEAMPLPDAAYDVVLCGMGLQFFSDRQAALREARRVLAPGGRLHLSVPGPTPEAFEIMAEALARHVAPAVAGFVQAVFSLYDADEIRDLLESAGFEDTAVDVKPWTLGLPAPRAFLWEYVHSTPLAGVLAGLDDETRDALERDVVGQWEAFTSDGSLIVEVDVASGTARRP